LEAGRWGPRTIVPNHVCIVVHLNDVIVGIRGDAVETSWPVVARGRGYELSSSGREALGGSTVPS
jgi:hypothetical protein